jgi:hypothetical protein
MSEMHLLMRYFSHFDGSKTWEEIEPIVEATFHDDLIVLDGREKSTKVEFTKKLRDFVEAGGWMEILKLKVAPHKQGIRYELNFHHPNTVEAPIVHLTKSLGQFSPDNGKLLRVTRDQVRYAQQIL